MGNLTESVTEIDIMAYADGLLDGDVERKRIVEAHIARNPGLSARVENIRAQNAAIRERYGTLLSDPVPPRIAAALERRPLGPAGTWPRAAALAGLLIVSGVAGWLVGSGRDSGQSTANHFVERAAREHQTSAAAVLERTAEMERQSPEALSILSREISFQISAPDLRKFGYTLIDKQQVGGPEDPIVRLVYQNAEGSHVSLLLRPRWEEETTIARRFESDDGVTIRHWLDGPIELALVTSDNEVTAAKLASAIHEAIAQARLRDIASTHGRAGPAVKLGNGMLEGMTPPNKPVVETDGAAQRPVQTN